MKKTYLKKAIAILFLALFLSCSLTNKEGFRLFAYPQFIHEGNVCVQTLDGFEYNGEFITEKIIDLPASIKNPHDYQIQVKITDINGSFYIILEAKEAYVCRSRD